MHITKYDVSICLYIDLNLARLFAMSSRDQISSETDVAKINPSVFLRGEFSPSNKIVRVHSGAN